MKPQTLPGERDFLRGRNEERERLHEKVEGVIEQLRGVESVHVIFNDDEEIDEIHVLANLDRLPKQIVRDIESALMTQLKIRIDYTKVSIAQMKGENTSATPRKESTLFSRIRFCHLDLSTSGLTAEAKVKLQKGDKVAVGTASGPNSRQNQLRLIGRATLEAVQEFLPPDHSFVLDDIFTVSIGKTETLVAVVTSLTPRRESKLVGSAFVSGDYNQRAIFTILDAINRPLGSLVEGETV